MVAVAVAEVVRVQVHPVPRARRAAQALRHHQAEAVEAPVVVAALVVDHRVQALRPPQVVAVAVAAVAVDLTKKLTRISMSCYASTRPNVPIDEVAGSVLL
jgi:hypothetical protein